MRHAASLRSVLWLCALSSVTLTRRCAL